MRSNRKRMFVAIMIVLLLVLLASFSIVSGNEQQISPAILDGGLIDKVNIWCRGPYLIQIILREYVFTVSFNHTNGETIKIRMGVNVTKRDGTQLFGTNTPFIRDLPPKCSGHMQFWTFPDFRKVGHLFGFFNVNVDFTVLTDNSSKRVTFPGLIFGISAIIIQQ